ncbi:MAG: hypothetical protein IJ404_07085 [Clostridia bacterium]|nr:hypothetical protein [Clostridia bacterium]
MNTFFDKFHIGTYYFQKNARTEQGVKDLSESGIDVVFCIDNDREMLDLFSKYGVSAVVSGVVPGWFGGHGENAGTMCKTNKREAYIDGINAFVDHPAIVGIDAGDEPSSVDFPYYGQMIALMKELAPSKFPYLNIYPSYGMLAANTEEQSEKELGVPTYKDYIDAYGKNIDLPYLSFDHYYLTSSPDRLFSDLKTAAVYCRDNGKKLYYVGQVNSLDPDHYVTEDELAFQAFSAMAHGASAVSWACYSAGWWHHNVLDPDGSKTEQYEKLKKINHKMIALSKKYIKYSWIDTERTTETAFGAFESIVSTKEALVGKFVSNGKEAIFVSPVEYDSASGYTLTVKVNGKVTLYTVDEKAELPENGVYTIALNGAEPCFITVE